MRWTLRNSEADFKTCGTAASRRRIRDAAAGCLRIASIAGLYLGDYEAARPLLERFLSAGNPSAGAQATEFLEALAGRADRQAFARRLAEFPINRNFDRGCGNALMGDVVLPILVLLGERGMALDYLERLVLVPSGNADCTIMLPVLDPSRTRRRCARQSREMADGSSARAQCVKRVERRSGVCGTVRSGHGC